MSKEMKVGSVVTFKGNAKITLVAENISAVDGLWTFAYFDTINQEFKKVKLAKECVDLVRE